MLEFLDKALGEHHTDLVGMQLRTGKVTETHVVIAQPSQHQKLF